MFYAAFDGYGVTDRIAQLFYDRIARLGHQISAFLLWFPGAIIAASENLPHFLHRVKEPSAVTAKAGCSVPPF